VVLVAGDTYAPLGSPDPGVVTAVVVTCVRFLADAAGVVAAGALVFAAFVVPRTARTGETLTADAYAAVRTAATAAGVWLVAAVAMVPLSAADAVGRPPAGDFWAALPGLVDATEEPKAWLCVAAVAAVLVVGLRATLTWPPVVLWWVVSVVGLIAPVVAGHVANGRWHDVATNAMVWHVLAGVWVGALFVLWRFLRRPTSRDRERVLRRYHRLTLVCAAFHPRATSGLIPVLGGFVLVLLAYSTHDLITGAAPVARVAGHGLLVAGLILLILGNRQTRDDEPRGTRQAGTDSATDTGSVSPGPPGRSGRGRPPLRPASRHRAA
jgi:uncharacterized membrane protein